MIHDAAGIATALNGKKQGRGWQACCPAHDDSSPSLSIQTGREGVPVVHCHSGCTQEEVIAALRARGLWHAPASTPRATMTPAPAAPPPPPAPAPPVPLPQPPRLPLYAHETRHIYHDADGHAVAIVDRYRGLPGAKKPKDFRQWSLVGSAWLSQGLAPEYRPVYRQPDVMRAIAAGEMVYLVEGEKCADALAAALKAAGLPGAVTATIGGSNHWRQRYAAQLGGAKVCILPDHDDPGTKYATAAASDIRGARILWPCDWPAPTLDHKGDVADWLAAGGDVRALVEACAAPSAVDAARDLPALDALDQLPACPAAVGPRPYVAGGFAVGEGKAKQIRARDVRDVATEARRALGGWPRFMPGGLFVETDDGAVRTFGDDAAGFKAWLNLRVDLRLPTTTVDACDLPAPGAKFSDVVAIWRETGRHHAAVSDLPHCPPLPGVYYPAGAEKACTGDPGELWRFLGLLPPAATPADEVALVAFICTPRYGQTADDKAAFIVTSPDAQGAGKSTTVEAIGRIHTTDDGAGCVTLAQAQKRPLVTLLLTPGADAPIVHLDNPTGELDGSEWAQLQTARRVEGDALYRGHASKPNLHTYAVSANLGEFALSADLRSRLIEISIRRPQCGDKTTLERFLVGTGGPAGVRAACMALLRSGASEAVCDALAGCYRAGAWVRTVLAPAVEAVAKHRGMDAIELAREVAAKLRTKPQPNDLLDRDAFLGALKLALGSLADRGAIVSTGALSEHIDAWCAAHDARPTAGLRATLRGYLPPRTNHRAIDYQSLQGGHLVAPAGIRGPYTYVSTLPGASDAIRRWQNGGPLLRSDAKLLRPSGDCYVSQNPENVGPADVVTDVTDVTGVLLPNSPRARAPESGELIGKEAEQTEQTEQRRPCNGFGGFAERNNGVTNPAHGVTNPLPPEGAPIPPGADVAATLAARAKLAIHRVVP